MFCYEPAVMRYRGTIIANPEWVARDCITITGDWFTPIRIIKKADIISGVKNLKVPKPIPKSIHLVKGSKGNDYVVIKEGAQWTCTCVGFQYHKDCKHIRAVKNDEHS
jgi:hypothetical protein